MDIFPHQTARGTHDDRISQPEIGPLQVRSDAPWRPGRGRLPSVGLAAVATAEPKFWDIETYDYCMERARASYQRGEATLQELTEYARGCCEANDGVWNASTEDCQAPPGRFAGLTAASGQRSHSVRHRHRTRDESTAAADSGSIRHRDRIGGELIARLMASAVPVVIRTRSHTNPSREVGPPPWESRVAGRKRFLSVSF